MNDASNGAIKHLVKLIESIAAGDAIVRSVSVESRPRFIAFQPLGGLAEYRQAGPMAQTLTLEIERR